MLQGHRLPCRGHSNLQVLLRGQWCLDEQQSMLGWIWWSSRSHTHHRRCASGYKSHELQCSLATCGGGKKHLLKLWQTDLSPLWGCKSALLPLQIIWKNVSREAYLLEGPFVQRPLAGVQYASPSFIQCFRHVHVALKTICRVKIRSTLT